MAQTVELYFPTSDRLYFGFEAPPKCPEEFVVTKSGAVHHVAYTLPDGSLILWNDKVADQYFPDGKRKTWWAKPTLKDAVGAESHGMYFLFHPDGSVEASYPQGNYYWSAGAKPWDLPEGSEPAKEYTAEDGHYYLVGERKVFMNYVDCPYPCCGAPDHCYSPNAYDDGYDSDDTCDTCDRHWY